MRNGCQENVNLKKILWQLYYLILETAQWVIYYDVIAHDKKFQIWT